MNVFILDYDPKQASVYHIDAHVRKMIVESGQMLSTAVRLNNPGDHPIYQIAYPKHPCTIQCSTNRNNYVWVLELMTYLLEEFKYRFSKEHKSNYLIPYLNQMASTIPEKPLEFAQAMPDEYRAIDPVEAYRSYYRACKMADKNGKPMGFWTKRNIPEWLTYCEAIVE